MRDGLSPAALDGIEAGVLVVDHRADRVLLANPAACTLLERPEGKVVSRSAVALFAAQRAALVTLTEECLLRGTAWSDALSLALPGRDRRRNVELFLSRIDEGEDGGTRLLMQLYRLDAMRARRAKADYERMRRAGGRLADGQIDRLFRDLERGNQLILNAAGEGIYGINARGETTFLNPAAERMLGWRSEEVVGRNAHQVMHHSHEHGEHYPQADCPIYAAFSSDGAVHRVTHEVFWRRDGSCFPVEYTSTPIDDRGQIVGAVVVFRDVSEQRDADRKLHAALDEVKALTERLEKENAFLLHEIRSGQPFGEIVGDSPAIRTLASQVEMVARTETSVLITGESGTGKELIAHAIHAASARADRPIVTVNCAAIPRDLFESEFFGHCKGAFTGALTDRIGRFEMADGGTIFLDEIGEMPLEMQSKLLRALQEGRFERVGDARTIESDFRVIAATNRDLREDVRRKVFREDLYYRLAVFPIEAAPLRERTEDIPALIQHFLGIIAKESKLPPKAVSIADMERLQRYHWPGNVRELRNVLEHASIISKGERLSFPLLGDGLERVDAPSPLPPDGETILTDADLRALEKANLVRALERAGGRVSGPGGAAEALALPPQTLYSRIKRLGLDAPSFRRDQNF